MGVRLHVFSESSCRTQHVSLMRHVLDKQYANQCKKEIHTIPQDSDTDSVGTL